MLRVLLALLVIGLTVYALTDCLRTDEARFKQVPKAVWVLIILFVVLLGPLAWLLLGREPRAPRPPRSRGVGPPPPVAPDDDPNFLRDLDIERWRRQRKEGRDHGDDDGDTDPVR